MKIIADKNNQYISSIEFCCGKISLLYQIGKIEIVKRYGHYILIPKQEKESNGINLLFFNYCPHCGTYISTEKDTE